MNDLVALNVICRSTALTVAACVYLTVTVILASRDSASSILWWIAVFAPPGVIALAGTITNHRLIVRVATIALTPFGILSLFSVGLAVLPAAVLLLAASNKQKQRQQHLTPGLAT